MSSKLAPSLACTVMRAGPADVDRAFADLSRDMDPDFTHVFLDKLTRYAKKPDRALFLAESQGKVIGFATIIDQAPAPAEAGEQTTRLLANYACGTGLMVLPEFRHRGIAACLLQHWQDWALEESRQGIWVVTHRMADWYERNFSYITHGVTIRHGIKKKVLIKTL